MRAKSLIVTVIGDSVVPFGGGLYLGALIKLMAPLGIGDRVVRTAVYRLGQDGYFNTDRSGRRSFYSLSDRATRQFAAAELRIYAAGPDAWNGEWVQVVLSQTLGAKDRDHIRKELSWLGFAAIAPNVFIQAVPDQKAVRAVLRDMNAEDKAMVFSMTSDQQDMDEQSMRRVILDAWPLEELRSHHQDFLDLFQGFTDAPDIRNDKSGEQAFVLRSLLVHVYRRTLLRTPSLPRVLMPEDWLGDRVSTLYQSLYRQMEKPARNYVRTILAEEADQTPKLQAPYGARFGGLLQSAL